MPLIPNIPPQTVPVFGGFDYVTVDADNRRVYAAHTASEALTIVDADSGKVLGQVRVGPMHGVAVDPASGHVYTGDGDADTVSEIDPVTMKVLRTANVDGKVDAIAFDPSNGHIYADEDDGTRVFVVDAKTMTSVGTIALPGHKPEYLSVDPVTHELYQNISDLSEFVSVDPVSLKVTKTFATPEIKANHPLQFDPAYGHVLVGGQNGLLAAYDTTGKLVGATPIQARVDQCTLDRPSHVIACAGSGMLTVLRDNPSAAPTVIAQTPVARGAHSVGIDAKTGNVWIVWSQADGDFTQSFSVKETGTVRLVTCLAAALAIAPFAASAQTLDAPAGATGAVDLASTAVEDLLLAYADGKPLAPPAARFVAFVGHDTNLEELAGMLHLH